MPVYLTPGVYVEELLEPAELPAALWSPSDAPVGEKRHPIRLAGAGAAAFVGLTERPPQAGKAVAVEGWEQYVAQFGGCVEGAVLPDAVQAFFANGGKRCYVVSVATPGPGGEMPALRPADLSGDHDLRTGLAALDVLPDVTLACAPDLMPCAMRSGWTSQDVTELQHDMIAASEARGTRLALLDAPPGLAVNGVLRWRRDVGFDSDHAALYYPWLRAGADPASARLVPPSGHVAGVLMRAYEAEGPHASVVNHALADVVGAETSLTSSEQDVLNPLGINVLREFADTTVRIWGQRTLSSDPARRLVQDRVLLNAIARSIHQDTDWVIVQRDNARLRDAACRELHAFLDGLWRSGVLAGESEREAYYVTPAQTEGDGQLVVGIGVAIHDASDFTALRIVFFSEQWARRGRTRPAAPAPARAAALQSRDEIFLSYARVDWDEFVEPLVATLRAQGFNVWVDQHLLRAGQDWMDTINDALERCSVMLLCVSPRAIASKHVKLEYRYFFNENKPILPVLCRPTVLPAELRGLQHVPWTERALVVARLQELAPAG